MSDHMIMGISSFLRNSNPTPSPLRSNANSADLEQDQAEQIEPQKGRNRKRRFQRSLINSGSLTGSGAKSKSRSTFQTLESCPMRRDSVSRFAIHPEKDKDAIHRTKLREVFGEAAHLEHVLMCSYLYSAYSIKSRWEELAFVLDENTGEWIENPRAPIHFETLREWQGHIVNVSKEEMIHLNFVNMLARAVGTAPNFQLPGSFPHAFENWKPDQTNAVIVDLNPLSKKSLLDFIRFESTSDLGAILSNPNHKRYSDAIQFLQQTEHLDLQCKAFYALGKADLDDQEVVDFINFYQRPFTNLGNSHDFGEDGNMNKDHIFESVCRRVSGAHMIRRNTLRKSFTRELRSQSNDTYTSIQGFYCKLVKVVESAVRAKVICNPNPEEEKSVKNPVEREKKLSLRNSLVLYKSGEPELQILQNLKLTFLPTQRPNNLAGKNLTKTFDDEDHFHLSTFREVVDIITEQGEGSKDFMFILKKMLKERYDTAKIHDLLQINPSETSATTPDDGEPSDEEAFEDSEDTQSDSAKDANSDGDEQIENCIVWNSHLAIFSRMFAKMARGEVQASESKIPKFSLERKKAENVPKIIVDNIAEKFNELYLVMRAWLHQMYLIYEEDAVKSSSTAAVATVVCWGLMSQTIRPMLELLSFVKHETSMLFIDPTIQNQPHKESLKLLLDVTRSADVRASDFEKKGLSSKNVNEAAYEVLKVISTWASQSASEINSDEGKKMVWQGAHPRFNPNEMARGMMFRRLTGIALCTKELILQIPFRIAQGKSGIPSIKDLDEEKTYEYSENLVFNRYMQNPKIPRNPFKDPPTIGNPDKQRIVYEKDQPLLRLQFSGWILNQLATDNDCNMNEIGYLGSFFSRYEEAPFDRRYVWTDADWKMFGEPNGTYYKTCRRYLGPRSDGGEDYTPRPKVELKNASLFVLSENLENLPSNEIYLDTADAITMKCDSEKQLELLEGFQIELREVDGRGPYNVGENHIIWEDGEPIDPFKIAVVRKDPQQADSDGDRVLPYIPVLERSVKNSGGFPEFTPQQRAVAGRGPKFTNYKFVEELYDWAVDERWKQTREETLWTHRLPNLQNKLKEIINRGGKLSEEEIKQLVELTERCKTIYSRGFPKNTPFPASGGNTLFRWRNGYCLYSHTVSGDTGATSLDFLKTDDNPSLKVDGNKPWTVRYGLGNCDGDAGALIHVLGEIYIPVQISSSK